MTLLPHSLAHTPKMHALVWACSCCALWSWHTQYLPSQTSTVTICIHLHQRRQQLQWLPPTCSTSTSENWVCLCSSLIYWFSQGTILQQQRDDCCMAFISQMRYINRNVNLLLASRCHSPEQSEILLLTFRFCPSDPDSTDACSYTSDLLLCISLCAVGILVFCHVLFTWKSILIRKNVKYFLKCLIKGGLTKWLKWTLLLPYTSVSEVRRGKCFSTELFSFSFILDPKSRMSNIAFL